MVTEEKKIVQKKTPYGLLSVGLGKKHYILILRDRRVPRKHIILKGSLHFLRTCF